MRFRMVIAGLALVAVGTAGCGGGGDDGRDHGATSTSSADFCGALKDFQDTLANLDSTADLKAYVESVKTAARRVSDVGTPKGIAAEAKSGLDLTLQRIEDLPETATAGQIAHLQRATGQDKQDLRALDAYISQTCSASFGPR